MERFFVLLTFGFSSGTITNIPHYYFISLRIYIRPFRADVNTNAKSKNTNLIYTHVSIHSRTNRGLRAI